MADYVTAVMGYCFTPYVLAAAAVCIEFIRFGFTPRWRLSIEIGTHDEGLREGDG